MREYNRSEWDFTWLKADGRLSPEEREYICETSAKMYLKGDNEKKIKMDTLEGKIYTDGERVNLEGLGGWQYMCKIENDRGRIDVSVLIDDRYFEGLNKLPNFGVN